MLNNVGYALAVEKLLGIDEQIPERAQYFRVIVGEISRITDHLTCLGAGAMELGAFTPFLYLLKAREWLWELLEEVSGARLTHSYVRIGGVATICPTDFVAEAARDILERIARRARGRRASCSTRTASSATAWTASASSRKEDAIASAAPGPCAALDRRRLRRAQGPPVPVYDRFDFDVPVGIDRRQLRPLPRAPRGDQAVDAHPRAGAGADARRPGHRRRSAHHAAAEAGDLQHDRGDDRALQASSWTASRCRPARSTRTPRAATASSASTSSPTAPAAPASAACARRASPSSAHLHEAAATGLFIADIVPTFGMINMIGGECDR